MNKEETGLVVTNLSKSYKKRMVLRDVSLSVKRGEAVGLLGPNGSGKSTLLKLISRITAPTEGEIELWGRVSSMLEVGTGFHREMTGRENIYMNGAILGIYFPWVKCRRQYSCGFRVGRT